MTENILSRCGADISIALDFCPSYSLGDEYEIEDEIFDEMISHTRFASEL